MPQNPLSFSAQAPSSRSEVLSAIKQASVESGVDFSYLLQEAQSESSLNPRAQAPGSSARGLFQFIESTWLETLDRYGAKYGLEAEAAAISHDSSGKPVVADPQQRETLLKLRENPHVSALMAAELTKDNKAVLQARLGREVNDGELYMAHFLGAGSAVRFLASLDQNPDAEAHDIVPKAAQNNQAVFYKGAQALTLNQVYSRFQDSFRQDSFNETPAPASESRLPQAQFVAAAAIAAPARPIPAAATFAAPPKPEPSNYEIFFALSVLQSLNMPGEDKTSLNEWVV